jgi:hypothetical protein
MSDAKARLVADADSVMGNVRRLGQLELEKRREQIGSPRFQALATQIAAISREIMYGAIDQERAGHEVGAIGLTIEEIEAAEGPARSS